MKSSIKDEKARKFDWRKYIVYIAFVVVFIFFSVLLRDSGFLRIKNIMNITRQTAMISVMAVGMTFVIATGQIDLSVGSIASLSALVTALTVNATNSLLISFLAGLSVGLVIGTVSGLLITRLSIPSFLVTLGMLSIVKGLSMTLTNTAAVPILNETFNFVFGTGTVLGIPILFVWTIVITALGFYAISYTPYGKQVLATGGNELAAKYTGVNTDMVKLIVMSVSGMTASLAGILYSGRMQAGRYTFGEGDELSVIAAVIIGGTSMAGGTGSVIGAIMGSLLVGVINNGLIIAGLSVSGQMIIRGMIIIMAVAIGNKSK